LVSSAVRELAQRQLELSGSQAGSQAALASVPGASGTGDILWWGFNVVLLGAVVYWAVRRRQV
jgi:hypothetical protein